MEVRGGQRVDAVELDDQVGGAVARVGRNVHVGIAVGGDGVVDLAGCIAGERRGEIGVPGLGAGKALAGREPGRGQVDLGVVGLAEADDLVGVAVRPRGRGGVGVARLQVGEYIGVAAAHDRVAAAA